MWDTNPSEYLHQEPMLLLSGRGVGQGYQGREVAEQEMDRDVAEQEMDRLQFLVVDTCDLFIALAVAVTSEGMVVKRVAEPSEGMVVKRV